MIEQQQEERQKLKDALCLQPMPPYRQLSPIDIDQLLSALKMLIHAKDLKDAGRPEYTPELKAKAWQRAREAIAKVEASARQGNIMKHLNPGTILEINDLHHAAAAAAQGFKVATQYKYNPTAFGLGEAEELIPNPDYIENWIIEVTETGPNAAANFLPKVGDFVTNIGNTNKERESSGIVISLLCIGKEQLLFMRTAARHPGPNTFCESVDLIRIVERNGQPFPQYKIKEAA